MELDKRIKAITDIKSVTDGCHDWELMNKKGYFANRIVNFTDLSTCAYGEYTEYREHDQCFLCEGDKTYYSYFLPEDALKPIEKKWRAYTIAEFQEAFTAGKAVRFRRKDEPTKEHLLVFGGYYTLHDGRVSILFGIHLYTLEELFEQYEWQEFYTDDYRPFGVEE